MVNCLIWRKNVPGIVTYLGSLELAWQPYDTVSEALSALAALKGW